MRDEGLIEPYCRLFGVRYSLDVEVIEHNEANASRAGVVRPLAGGAANG
jgi:hypothetical protein